jgi:SAM-dependent methyltransferase
LSQGRGGEDGRLEKVNFGSLRRLQPISDQYGFDRGKPVDRYYIESFLSARARVIRGNVLEIKNREYTQRFGGDLVIRSDVLDIDPANVDATIIADITKPEDFSPEQFDCVIFTQTLQYCSSPARALQSLARILRPGGDLLLTCPSITRIKGADSDGSWHSIFTPLALRTLLEANFGNSTIDVEIHGNVFAATCFLWGISVEDISSRELDYTDPEFPVLLTASVTKNS